MQTSSTAIFISIIGVISSILTLFMNVCLLKMTFGATNLRKPRKKAELVIFHCRFAIDVVLGALVAGFLSFVTAYCTYPDELREFHNVIFYLSLPASNVGAARSIVTLAITLERTLAAYMPIFYHNYRLLTPISVILAVAVVFGLFEDVVLFALCHFQLDFSLDCAAFGCAINACFLSYWTAHKSIIFALTFLFSTLLCAKLFLLNRFGAGESAELSRINRLALIDAGNVCIFDFLPSFVANRWSQTEFFAFRNIGPYGAVAKMFGCAVEAILVFRTLCQRDDGRKVSEQASSRPMGKRVSTVGIVQDS